MADYAAPELLVDTAWLREHLTDPNIRVLEMAQDGSSFESGHIPGAALSPDWQIKGSENKRLVAPPAEAKAWFESVGIGDDTLVIGYDRTRNRDAARLWWVLTYYGHTSVKVLNGGWNKWTLDGGPEETGPSRIEAGGMFTPAPANRDIESTVDKLTAVIGKPDVAIWDIRAADEFDGTNARGNARAGHVPGARHLEWVNLVNDDHTFKSADELWALASGIGITPETEVHVY